MKSHFVFARESQTFFRTLDALPWPDAKDKLEADLYEQHEACNIATKYFGLDGHTLGKWEIMEATPTEIHSWRSRLGGQARTAKQDRARKMNGERHGGWRHRVCQACGGKITRETPPEIHTCEECRKI